VRGKKSDIDKARAIYEWVVDNTFRNPKTWAAVSATSPR